MNSKVYAGGFVGALALVGYIGYRIGSQEAMKTTKETQLTSAVARTCIGHSAGTTNSSQVAQLTQQLREKSDLANSLAGEIAGFKDKLSSAEAALAEAVKAKGVATERAGQLQSQLDIAKQQPANGEQSAETSVQALQEIKRLTQQLLGLETKLTDAVKAKDVATERLEQLQQEFAQRASELRDERDAVQDALSGQAKSLEAQLKQLQVQLDIANQKPASGEKSGAASAQALEEIGRLTQEIQTQTKQIATPQPKTVTISATPRLQTRQFSQAQLVSQPQVAQDAPVQNGALATEAVQKAVDIFKRQQQALGVNSEKGKQIQAILKGIGAAK